MINNKKTPKNAFRKKKNHIYKTSAFVQYAENQNVNEMSSFEFYISLKKGYNNLQ